MTPVPLSSRLTPLPKPPTNDKATGLPNRRVLLSDESLSQLLNGFDGPLRVAFLDFVGMGATNKFGIGTAYTDKALRRFAGVVKSAAKQSNIIVKAVRLGGDEFALIAPNMTDDKWNEFLGNLETKWLEARNRVVKKLAYSEKKNLEKAESYVLTKGLLRDLMQPTIAQPADDLKRFTINTFRIGSAVTSSNTWDLNAINAALLIAEQEMLAKKASNGERENSSNASEATQLNEKPSASEENPTKLSDITYRLRDVLEAPLNQVGVGNETVQFVRLNIVNFGLINNAFGHETGDKVLLFFAEKIKRFAGDNSVLIHMGGGAFGVFVSEGVSEITETFGDNLADGFTNALFPYFSQEAGYSY
jgi:GGDEF domain-containing protein